MNDNAWVPLSYGLGRNSTRTSASVRNVIRSGMTICCAIGRDQSGRLLNSMPRKGANLPLAPLTGLTIQPIGTHRTTSQAPRLLRRPV
jgi:hypothetical protein